MEKHSRATQEDRTKFWEHIQNDRIDQYNRTQESMTLLRPIDFIRKKRQLGTLSRFIAQTTTIIDESRIIDERLQYNQHQSIHTVEFSSGEEPRTSTAIYITPDTLTT